MRSNKEESNIAIAILKKISFDRVPSAPNMQSIMRESKKEKERGGVRERERQKERKIDRVIDRDKDKQRERQIERKIDKEKDRQRRRKIKVNREIHGQIIERDISGERK